jgi:pimeloyl-ACP methyl ester carboxylesterase
MVWRVWGEGPPLVLLHGNYGSWMHWIRNVGPLARRFTVFVPDIPGFGESAAAPDQSTPGAIGAVVADGIARVAPADAPLLLTGFSYGGRMATEAALLLGDRVETLVLVGPGGLGVTDTPGGALAKLRPHMSPADMAEAHRHNLTQRMIADPAKVDALAVHIQGLNVERTRFRLSLWSEEDRLYSTAIALRRVRAPVKGIWADRDAFAGDTLQRRMAILREIKPDADIRLIDGAGHWVQYEAAARFDALLLDMLAR